LAEENTISFSTFGEIEIKEDAGEFYSEGFVATTHPDRAENGKYKGDILSKEAVAKVVEQINSRKDLMADLVSVSHDWIKEKNPNLPVAGRAIQAELRDLPGGHVGAFVKTHHNKTHPKFSDIKYEVEKKYLPGYSIEYRAKKTHDASLSNGTYRLVDDLDLVGYGFASGRKIANPAAAITAFGYKEIMDSIHVEQTAIKTNEVLNMAEETKAPEIKEQIDMKEYDEFKKFKELQLKERKDAEIKELVKAEILKLTPEVKVRKNSDSNVASVEFKEWSEIQKDEVSVKEAFNRATALAKKTGALQRFGSTGFGEGRTVEFKCTGINMSNIEIKAPLESTTNETTDTDYLQSAAELSDIYAPAIVKMLNQKTTYWGLLPKVDFSGAANISWRAENVANTSAGAYAEGAAITKHYTVRQKLEEVFKFYKAGVQVTGQMIEAARSGVGDVFQAEVEAATRRLLTVMNTALFGIEGARSDTGFLGLEYIATSSTYTTLYGLTRSATNLLGASNSEFAAQSSAEISKPTLRTGIRTLEINGASRSDLVIICHPLQRDKIWALVDDAQRVMSTVPQFGFTGQGSFDGVPIFADKDANNDDIFIVNLGAGGMKMGVQVPVRFEDLAKVDDSRSGFLKFYGNQYAEAPKQAVYMIQGLATA